MRFLRNNRMMITVVGVVLLVLVRMLMLLMGVDPVNGYTRSVVWMIGQIAVAALFVILLVLPVFLVKTEKAAVGDGVGFRIGAAIAAGAFLVRTVMALMEMLSAIGQRMMMYQLQLPFAEIAKVVLCILSVGFFYLLARCGNCLPSTASLTLILGPIGLYVFRLIENFMAITTNPSVDSYALWIISSGMALFFLSHLGRILLEQRMSRGFLCASSVAALSLALASVAAPIFSMLKAPVYLGLANWADLLCDIAMILVAVFSVQLEKEKRVFRRRHAMVGSAVPARRRYGRYIPKH